MDNLQSLHTPGVITDYYSLQGQFVSTWGADAYDAVEKATGNHVSLWMMRSPLAIDSEAVKTFLERMEKITAIKPPLIEPLAFGVDTQGIAFVVFTKLDGHPAGSGNIEVVEAERRFISCLRLVDRLHKADIVCEDLCGASFWIDRLGDLSMISVLGIANATNAFSNTPPSVEVLPFVAPELKDGAPFSKASDIFAFGVLGYLFFTGRYPYGEGIAELGTTFNLTRVEPISKYLSIPPIWAEQVIFRCLEPDPQKRFQSAAEVLQAITDIRQNALSATQAPAVRAEAKPSLVKPSTSTTSSSGSSQYVAPDPKLAQQKMAAAEEEAARAQKAKKKKLIAIAAAVFCVIVVVLFSGGGEEVVPIAPLENNQNPFGETTTSVLDKQRKLQENDFQHLLKKWQDSDDPRAYLTIVHLAKDAPTEDLRQDAEKVLIRIVSKTGWMRSAGQVRAWLNRLRGKDLPPHYTNVLKALNPTLPMEERQKLLKSAYPKEPEFVLRLTASLALDSRDMQEYQLVLSQMVGDALSIDEASEYSVLALLLMHSQLATVFGEDIIQKKELLTNEDILKIMPILSERNDISTRAIADLALNRGILDPTRMYFLKVVRDRNDLPANVLNALISASAGKSKVSDLASFGVWVDKDAEKILLAILADNEDEEIVQEAFEILAGKSLTEDPAAALVNWVRIEHWDKRAELGHAVGVLAMADMMAWEKVEKAVHAFDIVDNPVKLVSIFLESTNADLLAFVLEKHQNSVALVERLELLKHKSKKVRIVALKSIRTNNIAALKIVIDRFKEEKDPEVKAEYRKHFDILKDRDERI
ncbi:MAG: protein kinase domain-containing protein [Bdellovibrionota bacterium]|jgi:serine/threonine protein kinase